MSKSPGYDVGLLPDTTCEPSAQLLGDQNRRWRGGDHVVVEDYFATAGWLRSDAESLLDLIYNEIRLREEHGESPELNEYLRRFPDLADALAVQFEVHRAMRAGEVLEGSFSNGGDDRNLSAARPLPEIDGYEVLEELGRGAMGVVYRARHVRLNRTVALKMILAGPHAGPKDVARFETEALAVARLQHPHIVQIHDIGERDGRPFVCLELVTGGSLAQRLAGRPQPSRHSAELVELLARAVHYAHEQQIVHRDLKPANVLLARSDDRRGVRLGGEDDAGYFEPKITDFGLAKLLDNPLDAGDSTPTGYPTVGPVGTPPYMAPEQASRSGGAYATSAGGGRATDVYALGAILYQMLTGRPPFLAASVYETLQQVIALEPAPPRRLQPQVPRDLDTICLACLRKEPHRRYATALELADDLRRYLDGRPIRQRPAALWEPAVKWAKRRPAAAAWVVLGAATFFGLMAGGLYYVDHRQEWARQSALDRYREFARSRDDALFQGTLLTAARVTPDDRAVADPSVAHNAIEKALAAAGLSARGGSSAPDAHLTDAERADVAAGCYELLVALAETTDQAISAEKKQTAEALHLLDHLGSRNPPSPGFYFSRARILDRLGNARAAAEERRRADNLPPVSAGDHYLTGIERYRAGDTARAIRSFRAAVSLQPNHSEAHCFLAICALNAGRPAEALATLTAGIDLRPDFAWPYLLHGFAAAQANAFKDAEADFDTALALDGGAAMRYAVHANRGVLRLRQGKLDDAVADLAAAVSMRPEQCAAHVNLARAYRDQNRLSDAAREIDEAVGLRPDWPWVYRARGQLRLKAGNLDAALLDFEEAIRRESGSSSTALAEEYVECGRIRQQQGRFVDAVAAYDWALRNRPDHAVAHYERGMSLLKLGRPTDARAAFNECLRVESDHGDAYRGRGQARVQMGDYAGAIEDYTQAVHLHRDASILAHRGWAYFFADALRLAEHDFEDAIRLDREPGDAHVGRSLTRVMHGDYRGAITDAEAVLGRNKPDTPEMMHNVACIFALAAARVRADAAERNRDAMEAGYRRQAMSALRRAIDMVPAGQRTAYWQDKMRPDSALDAIRGSAEFAQLDGELQAESSRGSSTRTEAITK
jgi:serine/threonine protein kinase/tetratricopeptide (TPR) repeat protein